MEELSKHHNPLAVGLILFNLIAALFLYDQVGEVVSSFTLIPVLAIAWLWGVRGGTNAGLLAIPFNYLLFLILGAPATDIMVRQWPGVLIGIAAGMSVGWLSDLVNEAKQRSADLLRTNEELHALVQELERAKTRAEEASVVQSQFVAKVSHELRTPLNSIIGFSSVLLKETGSHPTAVNREYLQAIRENCTHLMNLVDQILDLSRVEAGETEISLGPVSLEDLIKETVSEMQVQARSPAFDIRSEIPEGLQHLRTDRKKLKQVLHLLIDNALKFTERGSFFIRVSEDPSDHSPRRIDIVDTGIGIRKDLLETIFEPFKQADNSSRRRYGGVGLGLTISRHLCDLLGYRLHATSEEAKGSTFSIIISHR